MSVVVGVEAFRQALEGHEAGYVLIGGAACSILFDEVGADFRLTKDFDVVVIVDDCGSDFGRKVWDFVRDGGYKAGSRKDGSCTYYRFELPPDSPNAGLYPGEIELFARHPDFVITDEHAHIAPLPFDDAVSSLSAIILDDGYYEFIRENAVVVGGVSILKALHIIPLKMRAHVDNHRLHDEGIRIQNKVLRKHRADVVKLADLLTERDRLPLEGQMRADAEAFILDLEDYSSRVTRRKEKERLFETAEFLKFVYL